MEGSCKLGAMTTAVVEGAEVAAAPFETGSSLSKRDTACNKQMRAEAVCIAAGIVQMLPMRASDGCSVGGQCLLQCRLKHGKNVCFAGMPGLVRYGWVAKEPQQRKESFSVHLGLDAATSGS